MLGDYFRRLRRSRRLTQAELAARTVDSPFPVDQSYVSRLERGEIAGSVGKFFTVLSLVNANASSVAELLRLGRELPVDGQGFAVEELLRRARESTKQGELSAALSWALAGLHEAASSGDADGHAQALVSASIVLKNQGAWETARALALEAVNLAGIHQVTRLQAVLQSAACCLEMDEPVSAELLLDGLQEEVLADRPELAAQRWHNLGLALLEGGRPDQALEAFRKAADWYARSPSPSDEARLHARQAVVMVDLGLRDAGAIVMDRAFGLAERSGHAITRARVLLHAGRVDTLLRRFARARRRLADAEELAKRLGHDEFLFEARLRRLELALAEGDGIAVRVLRQVLRKQRRNLNPGRELVGAYERAMARVSRGGTVP